MLSGEPTTDGTSTRWINGPFTAHLAAFPGGLPSPYFFGVPLLLRRTMARIRTHPNPTIVATSTTRPASPKEWKKAIIAIARSSNELASRFSATPRSIIVLSNSGSLSPFTREVRQSFLCIGVSRIVAEDFLINSFGFLILAAVL